MNKPIIWTVYSAFPLIFKVLSKVSDQSDSPVDLDFNRQNINNYMYIMHAQGN